MNNFELAIKAHLDQRAATDALFAQAYAKPKKSIEECCRFIYGEVSKKDRGGANCLALSDDEVFGLAVHYYDEDDVKVEPVHDVSGTAGHKLPDYKPTEEDMEDAKRRAMQKLVDQELEKMKAKPKAKKMEVEQPTLFAL
jgi:hypothetical protein